MLTQHTIRLHHMLSNLLITVEQGWISLTPAISFQIARRLKGTFFRSMGGLSIIWLLTLEACCSVLVCFDLTNALLVKVVNGV